MNPLLPTGEGERLKALLQYDILDTPPDQEFDDLTHLAAHICGTPISLISLVDHKRQWFKSRVGLEAVESPRDAFFCAHAILDDDLLLVPDATADERFANNALVVGEPHIRFYAGAPLVTPEGHSIGTLCVIDTVPRQLDQAQQDALRRLARQVIALLEARPHDLSSEGHSRQARLQTERQRATLAAETAYRNAGNLRSSEERYRRLFETAKDGILILDAVTGRIEDVNPYLCQLLGYTLDDLVGKQLWEIGTFQDIAANQEAFRTLQEKEYVRYEDLPLETRDGQSVSVEFVSNVYVSAGKKVIQCNIRDITERAKAKEVVLESQRFLQSTLDALSSHIAVLDENGRIIAVNKAWRQFLEENDGTRISCGVGANYVEVCQQAKGNWAEEAPAVIQGILEVMAGRQQSFYLEYPCHSPQEERWFNVSVTRFSGESPGRAVVAHDNITGRKQAEGKLRQSEANLAKAQQIARLGSWELDLISLNDSNANSLRWSDEVFRIFGYQPRQIEVSRENFFRAVHPDDRERIMTAMTQAISEGKAYSLDHRILLPDGSERIVHEQSEIVLDERTGEPLKMVGTVQDITEPKQAEVRLSLLVQGLNQVVAVTDELLSAPDLDHLLRQAVELAREKLGLQRCSLYLVDRRNQELCGTYGTTLSGETSDEREVHVPLLGSWAKHLLLPDSPDDLNYDNSARRQKRWALNALQPLAEYKVQDDQVNFSPTSTTGWVAATPILSVEGPIGVMFNDAGHTNVPVDETRQELLVVYCSLLGNIIEHLRTEERLQQVIQSAHCLLWQADVEAQGDKFHWDAAIHNAEAAQEYLPLAIPPGGTYSDGFDAARHEDDLDRIVLTSSNALRLGKPGYTQEYRVRCADGTIHWLYEEVRIKPQGPEQWRLIGVCTDITERKRAEEALRLSEQKYRLLWETAGDAFLLFDSENTILEANAALATIFGYEPEEVIGRNISLLQPERLREGHRRGLQRYLENGVKTLDWRSAEACGLHREGREIPVEIAFNHVHVDGKDVFAGFIRDITKRKRAEEALRESETRYRALSEAAPDDIFIVNREGILQYINHHAAQKFNLLPEALIGRPQAEMFPPEIVNRARCSIDKVFESAQPLYDEAQLTFDNRDVWQSTWLVPLKDSSGAVHAVMGVGRDISEHKQTETRQATLLQGLNTVVNIADELLVLSNLDTLLCRAVELAREKLGLERCSIYLLRPEYDEMRGTYGTDAQGQTSDERDFYVPMREHWVTPLLSRGVTQSDTARWFVKQDHELVAKDASEDKDMRSLGKTGWVAATPIFSVHGPIGVLFNDTALSETPIDPIVQELVVIYCSLLGNIIERKQAEEALRQSHDELERRVAERTAALNSANESLKVEVIERQMAMDVLHQTAEAFRATQEMLQLVMNHIPQAIFWKDRNSVFLGCNYRLALNLGLASPEEIKGKTDFDFTPAEYASAYQADDKQVMETDTPKLNIEEPSFKADGSPAWLRTNKIPLHDSEDHVVGLLGTYEDITEQKEAVAALHAAREEADAANRAKSEFLSRMSHELRTPLNAILGFGQILDSEDLDPVSKESVGYILKGGQHLLGLINEVLDISRVEAGRLDLSLEPIDLDKILLEVCALVRPLAAERNIILDENTLGLKHGFVLADHQGLKQVLINLLSNAIKYNRDSGEVEVSCIPKPDGWIAIAIHDTGPGIEPQDMQKLFTPFERLSATNSAIEGTGLGLALSRRLVTAMGGALKVESTVGQGTTFTIELPQTISPEEQMTDMPEALSYLAMNKKVEGAYSVLCIEDNPSNLRLMQAIFESRPEIRLLTALQGSIGLDMARQHTPDLILLDLNLPDIHGKEVLSRLQESARTKEIPVVVISADATPKQVERLKAAGAKAYLTKPLNISQFLKTLDELLHPTSVA